MDQPHCSVVTVEPVILALAQEILPRKQIPSRILGLFDVVHAWLRDAPVRKAGHSHAVYDQCTPEHLRMRAGVPVSGRFADGEQVKCVELAAGRAAHAVHVGPYGEMDRTYIALHHWCRAGNLALTGESWEVYGDWNADASKLETGLFLRIDEARSPTASTG
jgi:effector-binding domain-containing protein